MIQKVQTHAQLKNREFSEEVQHGLYDVLHACSTRCALQETCTALPRWHEQMELFCHFFWHVL